MTNHVKREVLPARERRADHGDHLGAALLCAIGAFVLSVMAVLQGCEPHDVIGTGWHAPGLDNVYECDVLHVTTDPDGTTWDVWSEWEVCWDDDAASLESSMSDDLYADAVACMFTGRHTGPCYHSCFGCNATSGCWCPKPVDD